MANKKIDQLKKLEEENLNNERDKIKNCIDIENKSKRTYYENIKLSEYCIDKFGTNKWFNMKIVYKINSIILFP